MLNSSRCRFVTALGASALTVAPSWVRADTGAPRALRFDNLHTDEKLSVEYFAGGRYLPDAMRAVNHLLRDFRTGDVGSIDPALLDLLHRQRSRAASARSTSSRATDRPPPTKCCARRAAASPAAASTCAARRSTSG